MKTFNEFLEYDCVQTNVPEIELFNTDIKKFFLKEIIPLLVKAEKSFFCPLTIYLMPPDDDTKTIRINHTEFFKFIKEYVNDENKLKEIFLELTPSFTVVSDTKDEETLEYIENLRNGVSLATAIPPSFFKFMTYCFKVNEETFTYFELLNLIE